MLLQAFGVSETGPVRPINEDCWVCDESLGLFVVADGMGGHSAGEVASRLAIDAMEAFVRHSLNHDQECSWPYGVDPTLTLEANRLKTAICLANRRIFREAESRDTYTGMGTTVVAALVAGSQVAIGHAGDSRLYSFSGGCLSRLTRDDSWIETILAENPDLPPDAIAAHPMRNVLTNVLGARDQVEVHMLERPLEAEEWLLLCSDGVHGVLADERIAEILGAAEEPAATARQVVDAALLAGSRDNVTAVVVRHERD